MSIAGTCGRHGDLEARSAWSDRLHETRPGGYHLDGRSFRFRLL